MEENTSMTKYNKTHWVDDQTPINASNLNKIEDALETLSIDSLTISKISGVNGIKITTKGSEGIEISGNLSVVPFVESAAYDTGKVYIVINPQTQKVQGLVAAGEYTDLKNNSEAITRLQELVNTETESTSSKLQEISEKLNSLKETQGQGITDLTGKVGVIESGLGEAVEKLKTLEESVARKIKNSQDNTSLDKVTKELEDLQREVQDLQNRELDLSRPEYLATGADHNGTPGRAGTLSSEDYDVIQNVKLSDIFGRLTNLESELNKGEIKEDIKNLKKTVQDLSVSPGGIDLTDAQYLATGNGEFKNGTISKSQAEFIQNLISTKGAVDILGLEQKYKSLNDAISNNSSYFTRLVDRIKQTDEFVPKREGDFGTVSYQDISLLNTLRTFNTTGRPKMEDDINELRRSQEKIVSDTEKEKEKFIEKSKLLNETNTQIKPEFIPVPRNLVEREELFDDNGKFVYTEFPEKPSTLMHLSEKRN